MLTCGLPTVGCRRHVDPDGRQGLRTAGDLLYGTRVNKPPFKALVVEDEPFARTDLIHIIGRHPDVHVCWEAASLREAQDILRAEVPDIVFLDVLLGDGNGFDVVPLVPLSTEIIFVTAHGEHALRAFEVNALDYLTKPVSEKRFEETMRRIKSPRRGHPHGTVSSYLPNDSVLVKDGQKRHIVPLQEVLMLHSEGGNYTTLLLRGGKNHTVRMTLKQWEECLPKELFARIHRTTLISLDYVRQFWKAAAGSYFVQVVEVEQPIRVSRSRVSQLKSLLDPRILN